MASLIYIHGFLSSPQSYKAQETKCWLAEAHPEVTFYCPALSSYPNEAVDELKATISSLGDEPVYLIGSSLGGFWASYLVEQGLATKAVLVNPAVSPHLRFTHYVGESLQSYYGEDQYMLTQAHLAFMAESESETVSDPSRYWLMVQTGDEVLDYRMACERYAKSTQLIEVGGNHSFERFGEWLPRIMDFFER